MKPIDLAAFIRLGANRAVIRARAGHAENASRLDGISLACSLADSAPRFPRADQTDGL